MSIVSGEANGPAVVIRLELENPAPRIGWDCLNESEQVNLLDWLAAHPELWALIREGIDLAREGVAA